MQALSPPRGVAVGPRGLSAAGRLGRWGGFPMPTDQPDVVEIPSPHLERFIPQSTRDFWNALALVPQMFRGQWSGDEPSSGDTEDGGASSSKIPPEQRPNRPGSQEPWIVGPAILKEERERQAGTSSQDRRPKEIVDPNFRRLTRFLGSEGDQIVSDNSAQPAGEEKPGKQPATPLPDHHLDIPEFLLRQPEPEPVKPEKKWTDLPPANFRGGGNYGGNRGGGGGRKSDEECRKEWERAHKICVEAFENGTIGDIFKRWKSNFATGPFPKPNNEPWDVNDCKPGFVTEDCGGNDYERAPPPEVTKEIGRRLVQQKRAKRRKPKKGKYSRNLSVPVSGDLGDNRKTPDDRADDGGRKSPEMRCDISRRG